MKFVRYTNVSSPSQQPRTGVLEGDLIRETTGGILTNWAYTGNELPLEQARLLAPIEPNQIIGIGKNYVGPGETKPDPLPDIPVFFYKPPTSVIGPEDDIVLPDGVEEVKFESELAVIIGKEVRNIGENEVYDAICGYTAANDVTAMSLFHPDGHWTLGKAADTFTPLGPVIETELDLDKVRVKSKLNGKDMQDSGLDNIIVDIPTMVSYLSRLLTLKPGDVILTGAPAGAEMMKANDTIECIVEPIGTLRNKVRA